MLKTCVRIRLIKVYFKWMFKPIFLNSLGYLSVNHGIRMNHVLIIIFIITTDFSSHFHHYVISVPFPSGSILWSLPCTRLLSSEFCCMQTKLRPLRASSISILEKCKFPGSKMIYTVIDRNFPGIKMIYTGIDFVCRFCSRDLLVTPEY